MDDKKKKRSPRACLAQPAPAGTLRKLPLPASKSASFALPLPHLPSPKQRAKLRRTSKEKARAVPAGGSAGATLAAPLQHSFLTDVSDVCEMEGGLLNLLNDFHSGKLQAFGKECSFEQLEHVREMQEKLARLHFSLDVYVEELSEEQKKTVADRNLDQLLTNVSAASSSSSSLLWPRCAGRRPSRSPSSFLAAGGAQQLHVSLGREGRRAGGGRVAALSLDARPRQKLHLAEHPEPQDAASA